MTKLMKSILVLVLLMSMTACSKSDNPKESLKSVPSGFYKGFEKADYKKFNSYAEVNGLGGTKIWIEGSIEEISVIESEGYHLLYSILTDTGNNKWFIILDIEEFKSKDSYESLFGHRILITATYDGYVDDFQMPVAEMEKAYDRVTGDIISSELYPLLYPDDDPGNNTTQNDPEPEPEPDKTDKNTIRPDIKKAIDAYEDFIDEYIAFMKKYESSDNSLAMMKDYLNYISKLAEFEEKMGALEEDLNDAEELYFIEVMNRCNLKMLESLQ